MQRRVCPERCDFLFYFYFSGRAGIWCPQESGVPVSPASMSMSADGKQRVANQGFDVLEIRGRVGDYVDRVAFVHRDGKTQVWGGRGGAEVESFILGESESVCKVAACRTDKYRGGWIRFTTTSGRDFMLRGRRFDTSRTPKWQIVEFTAPSGNAVVGLKWSDRTTYDGVLTGIIIAPLIVCPIECATLTMASGRGLALTKDEMNAMSKLGASEWHRTDNKARLAAIAKIPIEKLLCSPRHEAFFLDNPRKIRDTISAAQQKGGKVFAFMQPQTSSRAEVTINVIGEDHGSPKRFRIRALNLIDGNRRSVSISAANRIGVLLRAQGSKGPVLCEEVPCHVMINGITPRGCEPHYRETWIPINTRINDGCLIDRRARGGDKSLAMKSTVPFDCVDIAFVHRGRPIGHVAEEMLNHTCVKDLRARLKK